MANGQTSLSKKIDKVDSKVDQVLQILLGDPDDIEKPGMVERLRNTEKWQNTEKWAILVMGGLIVTDLGTKLIAFVKGGK